MRPHSALARLQQFTTLGLLAAAAAWLAWHWHSAPWLGVAGFAAIVLGYAIFLAVEFVALYFVGRRGAHPGTVGELAHAWWGEVRVAPLVFCWRQPFRWNALPDHLEGAALKGRRGAVFIHGFVCNRGFWTPWLRRMRASGHAYAAVNLQPVFGSIDGYVPIIDDAVRRVTAATGLPPVLVCHSMGGLAARAWLREQQADARVAHIITIGTPHRGTWLGRFSRLANGRQMRLESGWLGELAKYGSAQRHASFTCWFSNCDNIVFPVETATLPGADNRMVRGVAHVDLAFVPRVMDESLARITAL